VQPASLEVLERAAVPPAQARAIVLILRHEMAALHAELCKEMVGLRAEFRRDMVALRSELRQEIVELRTELRQEMASLRHSVELKLATTVTQPQLYGALLGQMALLLGIAYFFVTHLQH